MATGIILLSGLLGTSPLLLDEFTLDSFERDMNTSVHVTEGEGNLTKVGVNPDRNLYFGEVDNRAHIRKFLNLTSPTLAEAKLEVTGNISDYLKYDERTYFQGREKIELEMAPAKPGYYEGNVHIEIETPRNSLGRQWLELKQLSHSMLNRIKLG